MILIPLSCISNEQYYCPRAIGNIYADCLSINLEEIILIKCLDVVSKHASHFCEAFFEIFYAIVSGKLF